MKMLDKLILSLYCLVVISLGILIVLGSLFLIDSLIEMLTDDYNSLKEIVKYIYYGSIVIILITIILKGFFEKAKIWIYKSAGHYDVSIHCIKEGNKYKFCVNWGETSKWVKNNIKEIEIKVGAGFNLNENIITLSAENEWEEIRRTQRKLIHNFDYSITIKHFK